MTLRFGNGMHKVGATRGRPPGSGGFGREKARAAADKQQRRIHTFFTVVASGGALVQGGINTGGGNVVFNICQGSGPCAHSDSDPGGSAPAGAGGPGAAPPTRGMDRDDSEDSESGGEEEEAYGGGDEGAAADDSDPEEVEEVAPVPPHAGGGSAGAGTGGQGKKRNRSAIIENVVVQEKRTGYTHAQKSQCLQVLKALGGNLAAAERELKKVAGFEHIARATLRGWMKPRVEKRRGRKVNAAFEDAVFQNLL